MWIFGDDVKEKYKSTIIYFEKHYGIKNYYIYPSFIELEILNQSNFTSVQLLHAGNCAPIKLLNTFDLDPCRCWFDGNKIYASPTCVRSLITSVIRFPICYGDIKYSRLLKYSNKGYQIIGKHAKWLGLIANCKQCGDDCWHGCQHWTQWYRPYKLRITILES